MVDAKNELLALQEIVHQKDAEISSLHDTMQQRDNESQQMVARLDTATRDYTAVHEESRQLRDRMRQCEETLAAERAEHNAMLKELCGDSAIVERESARLALERLHQEINELRRREAESTEVVGRLMADVEAGHRDVVRLPKPTDTVAVTYTREEHDADVERQLLALRAELEEMFGEDISRMKEQMRDHYSVTVDQLRRDLARSEEERSRCAGQASLWQQQYMALSQQGVSTVDISERLNDAIADNVQQRQRVSELTAQVEQLNAQLSSSLPQSFPKTLGSETSSELEEYKREITEKVELESQSLRNEVDALRSLLKDATDDRDQSVARCQTVEQELEAVRQELLSTRSWHSGELQQLESRAAGDIGELTLQLASAKEQVESLKFAVIKADSARDEMERSLSEKNSQLETIRKDCEQHMEQMKAENANALQRLSNDYAKRLEAEHIKMSAVIEEWGSREQKSLALIEELQIKYEMVKKEKHAITEQLQSSQMPVNTGMLPTPSAAVWGASDVDSVVAHLSSQLEKVARERDSAMQSLQTVYGDRIELQQTIKTLESERTALTTRANQLDAERQSLGQQLTQTHGELSRLKSVGVTRSTASLSSVGTGSIPNMPSVTDEAERQGPDVIDSLRAEFEELQRLRREKDSSSSLSTTVATGLAVSVSSQSEISVSVDTTSAAESVRTDSSAGLKPSAVETEETLRAEEIAVMKQEYSALCAELVRLREMLVTLQRVDREREQVRSQFELEIRLLRDEMLRRNQVEAAAVTETVEDALGDELKERDAEIDSLKGRLAMTLSRMEELIAEKDQQCAIYEHELEEVREEHSSALKRIDALVQEHNILIGGQVPLNSVLPENVREMPIIVQSEILESVDEDLSPRRLVYENQAKEIEHLRGQLHKAAQDIETLSVDRDRLNEALESNTAELLASLEKAAAENTEQQQMYEKKLAAYTQDIEQLNRKLDTVSDELERAKSSHSNEMEKMRDEYQTQINELSFSNDESSHEQYQELVAVRKQCAELVKQLDQTTSEKESMEQEYISVLQDVNKENSARISALRESFEQDLAQAQVESEKAYGSRAIQLEEELNQSRQEMAQLKECLELYEDGDKHKSESGDLEALQVLQLRINDLTETKDQLQQQVYDVTAENERLISEVEALQSEKDNARSQVATLPLDYLHGFSSIDAESFADTSGDSHIFYTPSKSKKTVVEKLKSLRAEKELLTNMVDRLNAEKAQLKSHLVTGNLPSDVFEADIRHLELSSPEIVEVNQVGSGAEVRLIALESEKELLAGMLEKLSGENEQLIALMASANDDVLDVSYDDCLSDVNNVDKSTEACEEPELTTDEVVTLRYEHAVLTAKLSELERQISSGNIRHTDEESDASSATAVSTSSQQALLLENITEERDKLYRELENARQHLLAILPYRETASIDSEQTIVSLIDQINHLVHQKNELEECTGKEATNTSDVEDQEAQLTEVCLLHQGLSAARQPLVDSSVQVDIHEVVHIPEHTEMVSYRQMLECPPDTIRVEDNFADGEAFDVSEHDPSGKDLSIAAGEVNSLHALVEKVRTLEERLGTVTAERDQLTGDLARIVQENVELKASQIDSTETAEHFIEALRTELDSARSDCEILAEQEAASSRQLAEVKVERDELAGKIGALQDALKSAFQERDQYNQSNSGAEAQLPTSTSSITILADMEHGLPEMEKSDEASTAQGDLVENNVRLLNRVRELEVVRSDLLEEKEAVAELYSKTVDELKARLVEMQATVESLQSEIGSKSAENDATVSDLISRLSAAEAMCSRVSEENRQKMLDLANLQSAHDEKQNIINELMRKLQSPKSDNDDTDSTLPKSSGVAEIGDAGVNELRQLGYATSKAAEQCTLTEDLAVSGIDNMQVDEVIVETAHSDMDEELVDRSQILTTKLAGITVEEFSKEAPVPPVDRQSESSEATDRKERYLHVRTPPCIAVNDSSLNVKNVTEDSAAETGDAAVQTDASMVQNADDDFQVKLDELLVEMHALKEERDEIGQKLLAAETCIQETQETANANIKAFEAEMSTLREELHDFETRYKTLESEKQEAEQTWQEKTRKLTDELHTVSVECDRLSTELESAKCDVDSCQRSCDEKVSCIEDLRSELAATVLKQEALNDELTTCKVRLEETASNETKLTEKLSELQTILSTVNQERDALKEVTITSDIQLEELKQTSASMKLVIEDLEVQLASLKDENTALTTNCNATVDRYDDLKRAKAEIESKLQSQVEDLECQIRSLRGELENAGLNLSVAERKYEELQQSLASDATDAAAKLDALRGELTRAADEKSELIQKLADADSTCMELKSRLDSTSEESNSLAIQLRESESELMELKIIDHQEALGSIESLEKECCYLKKENECLSDRCSALELSKNTTESKLDNEQQRASALQAENRELTLSKELLLSENGSLKQQVSEYVEKGNSFASSERLALENWTRTEHQLLTKVKGLETDLSAMKVENSTLKSDVERIPVLMEEVASIAVERDDAHKQCTGLEAEVVKLRENMEELNAQLELTNTELSESVTELTQRCEEAEREVDRLKKLADEKTNSVLEVQSALARTQEDLAQSQNERESLSSALASERNAIKEQTDANKAAMSEVRLRLSLAEVDSSKLEQVEKELALKCEELKVREDQLLRLQSVQEHVGEKVDGEVTADIEALKAECEELRTLAETCQLDANTARERLSVVEGLCQSVMAERDELQTESCALLAKNDEMSRKLVSLQQQLEQSEINAAEHGAKAVEEKVLVEQLSATYSDEPAAGGDSMLRDQNAAHLHEDQMSEINAKMITVESELETARETICRLQEEVNSLQLENESLQQLKPAAEDSLSTVSLELAASRSDTACCLQLELAGEGSSQSTEGWGELQARLLELNSLTEGKTSVSSAGDSTTTRLSSVHASRTFTKLVPSAAETEEKHVPVDNEARMPPEDDAGSSAVRVSRTFTKLVTTDTAACQTVTETGKSEIDVTDLYDQINRLQLELEEQKLSHCQLMEKLRADSFLNEQLKEKSTRVSTSSMTDHDSFESQLRTEIEAEIKRHCQSRIESVEAEYREKLAAVKDECDRQVLAAENCARAKILESSPSEMSVVESASSTGSDSTTHVSDVICERDRLRSDVADKAKEVIELREEIERLREENEKQKMSAVAGAGIAYDGDDVDLDEDRQQVVTNLESQLLMSTEENERLQQKISELVQQAHQQITNEANTVRQQMEEQHVTEMKVLEFRLQESYEQRVSRMRGEVEADLEEAYQKRKQALDDRFRKKAEDFRRETEHKFLEELKKVCEVTKHLKHFYSCFVLDYQYVQITQCF